MPEAEAFLGTWQITREIHDAKAGARAQFAGSAQITVAGARWRYAESGQLTLAGGASFHAARVYLWQPFAQRIDVSFEDGRFFHTIALAAPDSGRAEASHWCDPDQYDVSYDLSAWPVWRATWRVRGPKKDYQMTSLYTR